MQIHEICVILWLIPKNMQSFTTDEQTSYIFFLHSWLPKYLVSTQITYEIAGFWGTIAKKWLFFRASWQILPTFSKHISGIYIIFVANSQNKSSFYCWSQNSLFFFHSQLPKYAISTATFSEMRKFFPPKNLIFSLFYQNMIISFCFFQKYTIFSTFFWLVRIFHSFFSFSSRNIQFFQGSTLKYVNVLLWNGKIIGCANGLLLLYKRLL